MSRNTLIDERFEEIVAALRAETPAAPDPLRSRVRTIAAKEPAARRRSFVRPGRRVAAATALAALAASVGTAFVVGLVSATQPQENAAAPPTVEATDRAGERPGAPIPAPSAPATTLEAAVPAPGRRAQQYDAFLRLLVPDLDALSEHTRRALRSTRDFGGYVVYVRYGTPDAAEGTADLRVRVPVPRVQATIAEFSELGRILAQRVEISDLQQGLDERTRTIRATERRVAQLRAQLRRPNLTADERARLENRLARAERSLRILRTQRATIARGARYATVDLALTTRAPTEQQAPPGRLERAIDDATGVLAAELAIGAYVLIVASPFLVLLAAALFGNRAYRRHADQRLLERA